MPEGRPALGARLLDARRTGDFMYHDVPGRILFQVYGVKDTDNGLLLDVTPMDFDSETAAVWVVEEYGIAGWLINHIGEEFFKGLDLYQDLCLFVVEGITAHNEDGGTKWEFTGLRKCLPSEAEDVVLTDWHFPAGGDLPPLEKYVEVTTNPLQGKRIIEQACRIKWCGGWAWRSNAIELYLLDQKEVIAWRPIHEPVPCQGSAEYINLGKGESK